MGRRMPATSAGDQGRAEAIGIVPGAMEGYHVVPGRDLDLGDRELPRRHVRKELEHRLQRILVVVGRTRREQEDLGVKLLERELELLLVANVYNRFELGLARLVSGPDRQRVGVDRRPWAGPEKRK